MKNSNDQSRHEELTAASTVKQTGVEYFAMQSAKHMGWIVKLAWINQQKKVPEALLDWRNL